MSTRHPDVEHDAIDDALSGGRCPHCDEPAGASLAVHIARDCEASDWEAERPERSSTTDTYPDPPTLETAPETIDADDDLDARRQLADRLAKVGTVLDE